MLNIMHFAIQMLQAYAMQHALRKVCAPERRSHIQVNQHTQTLQKKRLTHSYQCQSVDYCKFGNFREHFIFAKLRICEVS